MYSETLSIKKKYSSENLTGSKASSLGVEEMIFGNYDWLNGGIRTTRHVERSFPERQQFVARMPRTLREKEQFTLKFSMKSYSI